MFRVIAIVFGVVLAAGLVGFGLALPTGFKTVHPALLAEAGEGTASVTDLAEIFLDGNLTGPAELFARVLPEGSVDREQILAAVAEMEERFPRYRLLGGPDPYLDVFFEAGVNFPTDDPRVMRLFAASAVRRQVLSILGVSPNRFVESVLQTRAMTPLQRFMPVETGGGAPLEASVLTTALLAQANYFDPLMARSLQATATRAAAGELRAVDSMEVFLLGMVSAGNRTNWRQLTQWAATCDTLDDFARTGALARAFSDEFPLLYTAVVMSENPSGVADYIDLYGNDRGWDDLRLAVDHGRGAVLYLLDRGDPLFRPHLLRRGLDRLLLVAGIGDPAPLLAKWVFANSTLAKITVFAVFFLAGLVAALTLQGIFPVGGREFAGRWDLFSVLRYFGIAAIVMLIAAYFAEPQMFSEQAEQTTFLNIEFTIASPAEIIQEETMAHPSIDQVTLLVLLIFFLVQLVIYAVCLIKITQIRRQSVSADLKIKLIENEENLFDTGLYVGLAGTVAALIMLAFGIVQASLIAAYASTLFGILFVAILKICHVRPLRRRFLIEAEQWGGR